MAYTTKKYPLEGKLQGISDDEIQQHRDVLYAGYINKLNEIENRLTEVDRKSANPTYSEYGELRRQQTFAYNGSVLHELYFENLGGKGGNPDGTVKDLVTKRWGSVDQWQDDFRACGTAARGWAMLAYSPWDHEVHNFLLDTHN